MNKRRRYKAKRRRTWERWSREFHSEYPTCSRCGDYIMACTCLEEHIPYTQINQSMDEWLGFKRVKNETNS